MNTYFKYLRTAALIATFTMAAFTGAATAGSQESSVKILTANFDAREVVQVEAGDFHFKLGQIAPVHSHIAPAVGYVAKGAILYQVEGEKPQIIREGDAFYEPPGQRILRFDNASATEEAIFLDFNLEQVGEPFIVFEQPPTEAIDRRPLPTVELDSIKIDQVDIFATDVKPSGILKLENPEPTLGLVAEGIIELRISGKATQRIVAGGSFAVPIAGSQATIVNVSPEVPAKVITFRLL